MIVYSNICYDLWGVVWGSLDVAVNLVNVHGSSKSKKQKEDDNGWITHSGRKVEDDFQRTVQRTVSLNTQRTVLSDRYLSLWSDETMSSWLWIRAASSGTKSSYDSGEFSIIVFAFRGSVVRQLDRLSVL